ncbi:MAG: Hpt domain-containing protein [Sphaerospermopsis sp. SIO1G1]|nr:Hpt domain-containing protein [Sphaerospermopsis sp. SIO1G1]
MNQGLSNFPDTQHSIDPAVLESLRVMLGNDEVIFAKVVQCYLEESPQLIQEISKSIHQQEAKNLAQTAHKLKSSSAAMGAMVIHNLCLKLENIGESGNLEGSVEQLYQLTQEFEKVETILQTKINNIQ